MEEREYRIYTSSQGDVCVFDTIQGEEDLEKAIKQVQHWHPGDLVFVREVTERVVFVVHPDGSRQAFE